MDLEQLQIRLERLERENRHLKRASVAVVLVICGGILIVACGVGAPRPSKGAESVETKRLVIKDDAGRVRAELGVFPATEFLGGIGDDVVGLTLRDQKGTRLASLTSYHVAPMENEPGWTRTELELTTDVKHKVMHDGIKLGDKEIPPFIGEEAPAVNIIVTPKGSSMAASYRGKVVRLSLPER